MSGTSGSGITFGSVLVDLRDTCTKQYDDILLKIGRKPVEREKMRGAFEDGFRTATQQLIALGVFAIVDKPDGAQSAGD